MCLHLIAEIKDFVSSIAPETGHITQFGQTKGKKMNTKQDVINALEMVKENNTFEKNGQTVITLDVRFVDMILFFLKEQEG